MSVWYMTIVCFVLIPKIFRYCFIHDIFLDFFPFICASSIWWIVIWLFVWSFSLFNECVFIGFECFGLYLCLTWGTFFIVFFYCRDNKPWSQCVSFPEYDLASVNLFLVLIWNNVINVVENVCGSVSLSLAGAIL